MIRFEGHDGKAIWVTPGDVRGIRQAYREGFSFIVYDAAQARGDTVKGLPDEVAERIRTEVPAARDAALEEATREGKAVAEEYAGEDAMDEARGADAVVSRIRALQSAPAQVVPVAKVREVLLARLEEAEDIHDDDAAAAIYTVMRDLDISPDEEDEPAHRNGCAAYTGGPCTRSCEHAAPARPGKS